MKFIVSILIISIFSGTSVEAQKSKRKRPKKNTIYKYKKYEKFDFDDILVEGDVGSPGDITVTPRFQRTYLNALPERKNFNYEINNAVDSLN
jgi:hypothetical protein